VTEEIYDIVVCFAIDLHIAEKDHNIAPHFTVHMNVAEETDGVFDWSIRSDVDPTEKLHSVLVGTRRRTQQGKGSRYQETSESTSNPRHHFHYTRKVRRQFPPKTLKLEPHGQLDATGW
jgi:hypothetical protein